MVIRQKERKGNRKTLWLQTIYVQENSTFEDAVDVYSMLMKMNQILIRAKEGILS